MASRFRNEITTVPVVRIKVTGRGLSTTIGWQGNNIALSSRSSLQQIGDPRLSGPLPTDRFLIPGTRKDYGDGNVSEMTSPGLNSFKELLVATRRREEEIKADLAKAKWQVRLAWTARAIGWISLASAVVKPIRNRATKALAVRRSEVATLGDNLASTKVSVNFDMDSEIAEPHRKMQAAFDQMASSQRAWNVQTEQQINRVKARSFANVVVSRAPALLRRLAATLVDTQDQPLAMSVLGGRQMAYFYPGFVLVDGGPGSDFAVIDITEVEITSLRSHFTETEAMPSDS